MPCEDPDDPKFLEDEPVTDWADINPYVAKRVYTLKHSEGHPPLKRLVRAIRHGEADGGKMKAAGSRYSFTKAQVPDDYLIRTTDLDRHLSRPFPAVDKALPKVRFTTPEHDGNWLELIARRNPDQNRFLVHVEAGIKIHQLLFDLDSLGLSLPTMGAGGGQSLAGALSTGTHGADVRLSPLVDFVRAIHLVGPGGQEWWIEPADGLCGGPNLASLPGWCPGTYVVRDDEWFHAALVSVGRFGVIYSMVLEVTRDYRLYETTNLEPGTGFHSPQLLPRLDWLDVRGKLRASANGDYFEGGVFDAPSHEGNRLRFYQVLVDLGLGDSCWVTRRWRTADQENQGLDKDPHGTHFLCADPVAFWPVLETMHPAFAALATQVNFVPAIGPYWASQVNTFYWRLVGMLDQADTVGDFLVRALDAMGELNSDDYGFAADLLKAIIKDLNGTVLHGAQTGVRRGGSREILDTHDYKQDGCMSANSAEFFFDANDDRYLDFVTDVLAAGIELGPVAGYVSLRFMKGSQALLAMQRWPLTVAIEIGVLRAHSGDKYAEFMLKVQEIANGMGAIPHWGQEHDLDAQSVKELYGEAIESWRWVLAEIEGDRRLKTFRNEFCLDRGLEANKELKDYRGPRSGPVLVASLVPLRHGL